MKRRTFIITAAAATAAIISTPIICNQFSNKKHYDPVIMPGMLGTFCDEQTIREIGVIYRKQIPEENSKEKLTKILLNDGSHTVHSSHKSEVEKMIENKIQQDFAASKIFVLKGWIISATEARQCALFSLT